MTLLVQRNCLSHSALSEPWLATSGLFNREEPMVPTLPVDLKHVKAATKIQAIWKGYQTRKLNPRVVEIRQEVRSRRAEQYISLLCHEVQTLRENMEADNKMRDLQTEAIRYIWSQLRTLQKKKCSCCNASNLGTNNQRKRSENGSPRGPLSTGRSEKHGCFDIETDSVDLAMQKQKKADVSWKEAVDEDIFSSRNNKTQHNDGKSQRSEDVLADTDEGKAMLSADKQGPADDRDNMSKFEQTTQVGQVNAENIQLKLTVGALQEQVLQLQDAMLNLSDRIFNRSLKNNFRDIWEEGEDESLAPETQVLPLPSSSIVLPSKNAGKMKMESGDAQLEEIGSARGAVPRMPLKSVLVTLQSPLREDEIWAICEQACQSIKNSTPPKYIALETMCLRKDGRVEFADDVHGDSEVDEMYLAPEVLDDKNAASIQASIFGISVVLWSSADWEMSADQAPQLSQELESLLIAMSRDDVKQRAKVEDIIKICEDYHAKTGVNSLRACSSIFAEVKDAWMLNSRAKSSGDKNLAMDLLREQEQRTKAAFRDKVVPDINSYNIRSSLKPVSERVLSPRRPEEPTPHDKLMDSLTSSKTKLRRSPRPKVFCVRDMFQRNPELVQRLNILPGQRQKNQKAMRLVMRRQSPKDPISAPVPGVPTAPMALRAEVSDQPRAVPGGLRSVVLRWHPAKIFDKHGKETTPDKIMGYRIYVNGHPKGMVAGSKPRALLEGLRFSTEYRVNVRAVSALGESDASNTVIAHITQSPLSQGIIENEGKGKKQNATYRPHKAPKRKAARGPAGDNGSKSKPQLGAIFPKRDAMKEPQDAASPNGLSNVESDKRTSHEPPAADGKNDDIIDRILRRYGIQQAPAVIPGYASQSTLSPVPTGYRPSSQNSHWHAEQASLLKDVLESTLDTSRSSRSSTPSNEQAVNGKSEEPGAKQTQGDITPKSMEMLAHLKNELLKK